MLIYQSNTIKEEHAILKFHFGDKIGNTVIYAEYGLCNQWYCLWQGYDVSLTLKNTNIPGRTITIKQKNKIVWITVNDTINKVDNNNSAASGYFGSNTNGNIGHVIQTDYSWLKETYKSAFYIFVKSPYL